MTRTGGTRSRINIQPDEALEERLKREKARRHLVDFSEYANPWYHAAAHHDLIGEQLEQVELYIRSKGKNGIGRLLVFAPPRTGKSEQVARQFPAWVLGKLPDTRVILTSYGADLATKHSRAARELIRSPRYAAVFGGLSVMDEPVMISEDSRSVQSWDLAAPHRGGMVAAGVGGGITGMGAHLFIVDDPFKNREEAESIDRQETVEEWWKSTAYSRLEDGAAIVGIMTRWDVNDWAGRRLQQMVTNAMADQYVVLSLPALAFEPDELAHNELEQKKALAEGIYLDTQDPLMRKPGEALWPQKYPAEALNKTRANSGELDWWSLYQQMPRPLEGAFFGVNDFGLVDEAEVPAGLQWVRYVDLALGQSRTSDYNTTVGTAMDTQGTIYLRDMLRVKSWTQFEQQLPELMLSPLEKGVIWGVEAVSFQTLAFLDLLKNPKLVNVAIWPITPLNDKVTRARPLQTRAKVGKVKLVKGSWNQTFINEAVNFPKGHDDQIDTATGGLQMLADLAEPAKEEEEIVYWQEPYYISDY